MDEETKAPEEQAVAPSTDAALVETKKKPKHPKDGTERLKPYRWQKGQSGNPSGNPLKLPLSDSLRSVLAMPLPDVFRATLEGVIKRSLPKSMTFAEGLAFGEACAPFAPQLKNFKVDFIREMRVAAEGEGSHRISIPGEQLDSPVGDEAVDISDRVMLGLLRVIKRRQELYNLDLPRFEAMEREARENVRKTG